MRLRFIAFGLAVCVGSVSLGASTKHEKEGKAGKKLEHHFEGIVARWLTSAGKLELGGRTVEEVSHEIITVRRPMRALGSLFLESWRKRLAAI